MLVISTAIEKAATWLASPISHPVKAHHFTPNDLIYTLWKQYREISPSASDSLLQMYYRRNALTVNGLWQCPQLRVGECRLSWISASNGFKSNRTRPGIRAVTDTINLVVIDIEIQRTPICHNCNCIELIEPDRNC